MGSREEGAPQPWKKLRARTFTFNLICVHGDKSRQKVYKLWHAGCVVLWRVMSLNIFQRKVISFFFGVQSESSENSVKKKKCSRSSGRSTTLAFVETASVLQMSKSCNSSTNSERLSRFQKDNVFSLSHWTCAFFFFKNAGFEYWSAFLRASQHSLSYFQNFCSHICVTMKWFLACGFCPAKCEPAVTQNVDQVSRWTF